jgi:transcriptional regulator with XRE-family HTH domain
MGLSQPDAARAVGVSQSRIAQLELGQHRLMLTEALELADLYDITLEGLDPRESRCRPGRNPGESAWIGARRRLNRLLRHRRDRPLTMGDLPVAALLDRRSRTDRTARSGGHGASRILLPNGWSG